jgi:hypothetical protein
LAEKNRGALALVVFDPFCAQSNRAFHRVVTRAGFGLPIAPTRFMVPAMKITRGAVARPPGIMTR